MSAPIPYTFTITYVDPHSPPTNVAGCELYGMCFLRTTHAWEGEFTPGNETLDLITMKDGELWADPDDIHALFGDDATWEIERL